MVSTLTTSLRPDPELQLEDERHEVYRLEQSYGVELQDLTTAREYVVDDPGVRDIRMMRMKI